MLSSSFHSVVLHCQHAHTVSLTASLLQLYVTQAAPKETNMLPVMNKVSLFSFSHFDTLASMLCEPQCQRTAVTSMTACVWSLLSTVLFVQSLVTMVTCFFSVSCLGVAKMSMVQMYTSHCRFHYDNITCTR